MRRYVWWVVVAVFSVLFLAAVGMFIQWRGAVEGRQNIHAMRAVACNDFYSYLAIVPDGQNLLFLLTDGKGRYATFLIPKNCTTEHVEYPARTFTWRWMPKHGPDWYRGMAVVRYGPQTSVKAQHLRPSGIIAE